MSWELVKGMPLVPHACVACGQYPKENDGTPKEALFAGGVDVDWGASVYICTSCQNVIVELLTGMQITAIEGLKQRLIDTNEELREERKAHNKLKKRVKSMLKGARAKERVADA